MTAAAASPSLAAGQTQRRPWSGAGVWAAIAWAICSMLYFWTANWDTARATNYETLSHHYEYLVDGFLAGHVHLSIDPSRELLALPDPYNPAQNARYRLGDASLFRNKYYLYFGPGPALLLMVPWKLLTGSSLSQPLAIATFACVGFGGLVLLLRSVQRRYFPQTPRWLVFFSVLLAGHLNWLPVTLRRPTFWELAIVAAVACFWWALFFLWKYRHDRGRGVWGCAAGAALGFALASRPSYLPAAGGIALIFAWGHPSRLALRDFLLRLAPIAMSLLAVGGGLLVYNYQRFGSIAEFGEKYMLWGFERHDTGLFNGSNFSFNAWLYAVAPPNLSPYFPFVHPVWIQQLPAGYYAIEEMHGLLFALPAGMIGLVAAYRAFRSEAAPAVRQITMAASLGSLFAAAILFLLPGACTRYVTELMSGWALVTSLGYFMVFSADASARPSTLVRGAVLGLGIFSIGYVWLASFEFRDIGSQTQPRTYRTLATLGNYPSWWYARSTGAVFGPVRCDVQLSSRQITGSSVLLAAGRGGMANQLILERTGPGQIRLLFLANRMVIAETPVLNHPGSTLQVTCAAPWLYPPAEHPYWSDRAERKTRQTLYAIGVDGHWTRCDSPYAFDATHLEPAVNFGSPDTSSECAWVDRIERLNVADPSTSQVSPATKP